MNYYLMTLKPPVCFVGGVSSLKRRPKNGIICLIKKVR